MTTQEKGILIGAIINRLNEKIQEENKELCKQNLHRYQKPLHGGEMWFKLVFCEDSQIKEIATACGF